MNYIDCKDVAKVIRKHLKREHPTTKFSVRIDRYSGGSSIDIHYKDGPAQPTIDAILNNYKGCSFDGMIDMQYSNRHWLIRDAKGSPETIEFAESPGTEANRGSHPSDYSAPPSDNAELVHLGSGYVFAHRDVSPEKRQAVRQALESITTGFDEYELERLTNQIIHWTDFTNAEPKYVDQLTTGYDLYTEALAKAFNHST